MKPLHSIIIVLIILLSGCNGNNKDNLNENASVSALDALPENPLLLSPITFSINPNKAVMSTLYGNKIAYQHAKTNADSSYPNGAVLYEVNWKQKADSLWYGANIPDQIISVEKVQFTGNSVPKYELYAGHPLKKVSSNDETKKTALILSKRMVETP
ncbi:hypothetical protein SAMN05444671_0766 [Flavobacterium sp. CF108]|uniref:hypothetical protein n=1 Tax=unclassified Flavobacterium TaxID=196869 RepID=UPI0008ACDBD8|nr:MULTISPECIES: hypothetical protein [unclassified Flavobacterium]SEO18304.1 hypothetical protein SAMN04487978_2312 [Flavobacterium sp. fv08]SHG54894.1 hypothetical protein SAMN05444671_0766 [Flavobacterium sp. CF108]